MTWTKKDSNLKKIVSGFLSDDTVRAIWKLENRGHFDDVIGVENEGKESTIIKVITKEKQERILKIHRIEANKFRRIHEYIFGDPRFSGIKTDRRSLVFTWAKKEYSNLKRCFESGISCPEPFAFLDNMVVMQAVEDKNGALSKKLKDTPIANPEKILDSIVEEYKKFYNDAKLVHSDLSEFNILVQDGKKPWLIDLAQAVHVDHPKSKEFLERDIKNLCRYFTKLGINADNAEIMGAIQKR